MKIGFVSGDWVHPERSLSGEEEWGGSGWVRFAQYMQYLPFEFVTGTLVWYYDHFAVRTVSERYEYVDIIFMHRLMHNGLAENILRGRAAGQIIINDIDDWYWGLDPKNHAFKATDPKHNKQENRYNYRQILHNSDLVIASTPYLADRLLECRLSAALTVVKNTVDLSRFTPKKHVDDGLPTLGWVGSTAHRSGDLETLRGVVAPLVHEGRVQLQHSGHVDQEGYDAFAEAIGIDDSLVKKLPMVPHQEYANILTMDIGMVPLRHTPFNQAKSDIKGLEYAAAGIPFVAQKIDSYVDLKNTLGVGRIAKNGADWRKHITALCDANLRQEESERNREAIQPRDISHGAEVMRQILQSFMQ